MSRVDHFHDPDAPKATTIVPACTVAVRNDGGDVLLIRRTDNNLGALPGGAMEFGEDITGTAVREVAEETGLVIEVTGLVGLYTDPHHVVAFSDGEVRQQFSILFSAIRRDGQLTPSDESAEVAFVPVDRLPEYNIHPSMRLRIEHACQERAAPYLG